MKKMKILLVVLLIAATNPSKAQEEWREAPKESEKVIGTVTKNLDGGTVWRDKNGNVVEGYANDQRRYSSDEQIYEKLVDEASWKYGAANPDFKIRNFKANCSETYLYNRTLSSHKKYEVKWYASATVVIPIPPDPTQQANENITTAISKATQRVHPGARIAVDQVKVTNGINEDDFRDKVIEILLDSGYKVVAKEFMQRLYDEQSQQQSGVYNEETTVQGNNFSAVGYYLNIKMTEKSLKVQVINVSTGEYEGNATVNF